MGKTNPLNDQDLEEFIRLQSIFSNSHNSWSIDAASINPATYDLSVKNPNSADAVDHQKPDAILDEIATLDAESSEVLATIRALL